MKTYQLKVFDEAGIEIAVKTIRVEPSELPAGSYEFRRKAEELYRDALFKDGLWDDYTFQRGAVKVA